MNTLKSILQGLLIVLIVLSVIAFVGAIFYFCYLFWLKIVCARWFPGSWVSLHPILSYVIWCVLSLLVDILIWLLFPKK